MRLTFACFLTAMSLTKTRETDIEGIPVQVDPGLRSGTPQPQVAVAQGAVCAPQQLRPPDPEERLTCQTTRGGFARGFAEPVNIELAGAHLRPSGDPRQTGRYPQ